MNDQPPPPKVTRRKITDYQPDPHNANKGTMRGESMLEDSFRNSGAGRSLLADKNGVLIAGNKSQQAAIEAGIEEVIEVVTTGNQVVVVRRDDLDIESDERAQMLAYYDNRAGQVSLEWDAAQVLADLEAGLPLDKMFRDYELEAIAAAAAAEATVERSLNPGAAGDNDGRKDRIGVRVQIKAVFYTAEDIADLEKAIRLTGIKNRGEAVISIMRFYLESVNATTDPAG